MKMFLTITTAMVLAFPLAGGPATRGDEQEAKQDAQSTREDAARKDAPHGEGSAKQDSGKHEEHVEKLRGELAGATIVGETMIDYKTGRGVVAELTYLTILGSPADSAAQGERRDKAEKKAEDEHREQGAKSRRKVYQIAVGPETQVCFTDSDGRRKADSKEDDQAKSSREKSQADLQRLELGDRVEVEFVRLDAHEPGREGGAARASSEMARHGRHLIVHGAAKSLSILDSPDHGRKPDGEESHHASDGKKAENEPRGGKSDRKD